MVDGDDVLVVDDGVDLVLVLDLLTVETVPLLIALVAVVVRAVYSKI